jgi:hypothetical protein
VFGTVLGLIAWIYLAVEVTVYSAEINVVLARRLWPRAIVQPPLTEADRASMALQALQNQRRPEQHVEVTFDDRGPDAGGAAAAAQTPRTPDEVSPPAKRRGRGRVKRRVKGHVPEPRAEPDPRSELAGPDGGSPEPASSDGAGPERADPEGAGSAGGRV